MQLLGHNLDRSKVYNPSDAIYELAQWSKNPLNELYNCVVSTYSTMKTLVLHSQALIKATNEGSNITSVNEQGFDINIFKYIFN